MGEGFSIFLHSSVHSMAVFLHQRRFPALRARQLRMPGIPRATSGHSFLFFRFGSGEIRLNFGESFSGPAWPPAKGKPRLAEESFHQISSRRSLILPRQICSTPVESFGFELRSHRFQTVSAFKVFFSALLVLEIFWNFLPTRYREMVPETALSTSCVTNDVRLQVHVPGPGFPGTV